MSRGVLVAFLSIDCLLISNFQYLDELIDR